MDFRGLGQDRFEAIISSDRPTRVPLLRESEASARVISHQILPVLGAPLRRPVDDAVEEHEVGPDRAITNSLPLIDGDEFSLGIDLAGAAGLDEALPFLQPQLVEALR